MAGLLYRNERTDQTDGHNQKEGISSGRGIVPWPTTSEEYAVFALHLQREQKMRNIFKSKRNRRKRNGTSHGDQFIQFCDRLTHNS